MKKVLIAMIVFLPMLLSGQNDIQLSQQHLSRVNYNPAATGASNYLNVFLIGRQQFVGFNGAPSTQVLNAHNYFNQINSGLGLTVINDKIGPESSINAKVAYAYYVHFEDSYLSFGLGGGVLYKNLDINKLIAESGPPSSDPTIASYIGRSNKVNADFDFGVEFNTAQFQVGASVTHLNVSPIKINNLQSGRHMYLYTKYTFNLDLDWKLAPSLVAHMSAWPIMQLDVNTMATYKDRFWLGASLRTSDEFVMESVVGFAGLFITDFLGLGYSYDLNLAPIRKYTNGSHEISLRFRIGKGEGSGGTRTPRFFE
ncbi:MAG: type IX secretion system membrane protein PorP/SprF [Prevotellaceae bacterium]|jgi:type IX secretion system PorP/SprF family membrane protein|nr:type IX secretion system membrane protein PorP/SprF [Prevotellaceae bacterium]